MARVLVVEDKDSLRGMLRRLLAAHVVREAPDLATARLELEEPPDLVLSDVRLPDGDGFAVLEMVKQRAPDTEVVLMTAYATVEAAVRAVKRGAYDYVAKPFEPDALLLTVERALERRALRARATQAEAALRRQVGGEDMLGESAAMRRVRHLIERVADLDVTVLITGESGTGKEVAARAVHRCGLRAQRPFVAVNCGAFPEKLLESELFGHARGAFTGATAARAGLLEEAGDGTLFLDEIGELPLDLQVKLNRVLEARVFRRVGESREREFRGRVVAATLRDLEAEAAAGRFRQDLYFRLAVFPIKLPPLRDRGDDLFVLAHDAMGRAAGRFGRTMEGFSPDALRQLAAHRWPGNIRELIHAVERAVILATGPQITTADLPDGLDVDRPGPPEPGLAELPYREALEWAKDRALRRYLDALLRRHAGNVTQAALQAEIERESLHRLLRKAGVDAASYR